MFIIVIVNRCINIDPLCVLIRLSMLYGIFALYVLKNVLKNYVICCPEKKNTFLVHPAPYIVLR